MMIIPIGSCQPEVYTRWLREQKEPEEYTEQGERLEKYLGRGLTQEEHVDTLAEHLDRISGPSLPESLSGVFHQH